MKRSFVGWVMAVVLAVGGAAFAYVFWFAGGSGEPTTDLTTPELSDATTLPEVGSTGGNAGTHTTTPVRSSRSFVIDPAQTIARFEIDEALNGGPKHVVGTTDQVAGQFLVDASDLSSFEMSQIVVNARTLSSDSERRDRAMRGPVILDSASDENELITLVVTSVDGLAGSAAPGEAVDCEVTGDLTIKGNTRRVTFDVIVSMIDEDTIEGSAVAEITRDMFEIGIPSVPNVADVRNEVLIGLEFVAVAG
jgi:polyisoprenoid-binding protein YceI